MRPSPPQLIPLSTRSLTCMLIAALSLTTTPLAALQGKLIGGPGYTFWRSSIAGKTQQRTGVGRGISGMGAYEIGEHIRITSGLMQAQLTLADHTRITRHLVFAGLRGATPLSTRWYASAGLEAGAARLQVADAVGMSADGYVKMAVSQRWNVMLQPVASIGFRPRPKYHLELMVSAPTERHGGAWRSSVAVMLGLFFWMGAGAHPGTPGASPEDPGVAR